MSLTVTVVVLLLLTVCSGSKEPETEYTESLQPEKQRTSSEQKSLKGNRMLLNDFDEETNSGSGESLSGVKTGGSGLGKHLPSPGAVQLQFINISSVLLTWSYHYGDTFEAQLVKFIVQCSHNGRPYSNCSSLLNSTCYIYSKLQYASYYQFRVLAYCSDWVSKPTETYYFVNGITAPPGPPTIVNVRAVSHREIRMQWKEPTTPTPLHYIIKWGNKPTLLDMSVEVYESVHYLFTGLTPGMTYYFQIIADISGRLSIPTSLVNVSTPISVLPPVQLRNDAIISSRWVHLSWMSPPLQHYPIAVANFTVYYSEHDGSPISEVERDMLHSHWSRTVDAGILNTNISQLNPATMYIFCVGYSTKEFLSELSAPLELVTLDDVTCYVCEPLSSTELLLRWKYFGSNTSQMYVFELPEWKQKDTIRVNMSGDYQYTVQGLSPWRSHTFAIALDTPAMVYDLCPVDDCVTKEAAPYEPPSNITIAEITAQNITVTWHPPPAESHNGIIQDYVIMYTCNSQCELQLYNTKLVVVPADGKHMNTKLTDLSPFTKCSVEIAARTGLGGCGPFSFKIFVTTDEDAPTGFPTDVAVQKTTDHSLVLSWGPPNLCEQNGNIIGYTLYIKEHSRLSMNFHYAWSNLVINVSKTTMIVEPLHADTLYAVSVAAWTRAGLGPCSLPLNATTMEIDGNTLLWKMALYAVIFAVLLTVVGVFLLLGICLLRWVTQEIASSPSLISMDNYSPTHLVQNDCITYSNTSGGKLNIRQQKDSKICDNNVLRHLHNSVEESSLAVPIYNKRGNGCGDHDSSRCPCASSPLHEIHN